jgi:hypothetical protein
MWLFGVRANASLKLWDVDRRVAPRHWSVEDGDLVVRFSLDDVVRAINEAYRERAQWANGPED